MDILQAIILGLIEGITEYIPVSSTGHLILAQKWMGLHGDANDAYVIVIQGGAILAVLGLYRKRVKNMIDGLLGKNPAGLKLALNLIVAFLPAAIIGFFLHSTIKAALFKPTPIIAALALGGGVMIYVSRWQRNTYKDNDQTNRFLDIEALTLKGALIIGMLQCIAMWPGTSRSMVTIVAAMAIGMRPKHAAEFSFLLGLPTLGGAMLFEAYQSRESLVNIDMEAAIIGLATAFIAASIAIKWLVAYLSKHGLALFGWYRIILAILVAIGLWNGYLSLGGNNDESTLGGGEATSSTYEVSTLKKDHLSPVKAVGMLVNRKFLVATQLTSSIFTGPITDPHCPVIKVASRILDRKDHRKP